ncbi:unnamed protein product [Allacma fusca]|uniref:Sodium-dependent nutrient amino acid transporter 1 n=1 Tax=Allacma fusca TaxID=39272 RepID=A0A8J2KXR2_9HEXA|nr:unnamed protein product [Allacma fusca]
MLEAKVWFAALSQCLFSLNTGFGPLIMLGSYNRFDRNIYRDTWIASGIDTLTSLLAGLTIFAFLGNLAWTMDVDILKVALTENHFAIIIFAQAVSMFEVVPQLFCIIFFLMMAIIGVGTATAYVGAVITVIASLFPKSSRYRVPLIVCFIGLIIGLMYLTPGGSMMTRLADYFGAKVVICIMALVEVVGVAWIYGIDNFLVDIEFMLKLKLGLYWKLSWCYFIPTFLSGILVYAFLDGQHSPGYKGHSFSNITLSAGWLYSLLAISAIPIFAFYVVKTSKGTGWQEKFKEAMKPSEEWGPKRCDLRQDWLEYKKHRLDNEC